MKKFFVPLVLGLLSMGIFISCGDDDDSSNGPVIPWYPEVYRIFGL